MSRNLLQPIHPGLSEYSIRKCLKGREVGLLGPKMDALFNSQTGKPKFHSLHESCAVLTDRRGSHTRTWDVRTKKVTYETVPTTENVTGISNYGPTATLFTIGLHHMIQQYDLNPSGQPLMVANVQHAPINAPPTPPDSMPRETPPPLEPPTIETCSSEEEGVAMSPLQKIAQEMDQIEEERRDRVGPLSPVSSRASSRNSMGSASSYGRRQNKSRNRDRSYSPRVSDNESEVTTLSTASSMRSGHESMSIRSISTSHSSRHQPSSLRKEMLRSPDEPHNTKSLDLFPFIRARLSEVKFRTPQFNQPTTPDVLRREMLSVIFGWDDDIESLIRDEQARHPQSSASSVLLQKWLGDIAADQLSQMGSQSMTSSDWMLLALTCQVGQGSQKQVGEAFVRRLLETDEIHPAVAILLGLGEQNDAVEAYVSRRYYLEAVLLTCLLFPADWQRQSYLVRKWGEIAVADKQAELAVRCFSCTSIESSEPWFSPRAQGEVFAAQQQQYSATSPPNSPPSAGGRLTTKNASLKLITNFGDTKAAKPQASQLGVTPIIDSAISPAVGPYKRSGSRGLRDPSSARTATPGGYSSRRRAPSAGLSARDAGDVTPMVDELASRPGSRTSRPGSRLSTHNETPGTAFKSRRKPSDSLPSPAPGVFASHQERSEPRDHSRDRNPHGLQLQMVTAVETEDAPSPQPTSATSNARRRRSQSSFTQISGYTSRSRTEDLSPLPTDGSTKSFKGRNIDRYINSLEEANYQAQQVRERSRSRNDRSRSRPRQRDGSDVAYIKPSKRSPSSPIPMTSEDARRLSERESMDAERQGLPSPVDSRSGRRRAGSRTGTPGVREKSKHSRRRESPDSRDGLRSASKQSGRRTHSPEHERAHDGRGRGHNRISSGARSPSSPLPMDASDVAAQQGQVDTPDTAPRQPRQRSSGRRPSDSKSAASPDRGPRALSGGRRPKTPTLEPPKSATDARGSSEFRVEDMIPRAQSSNAVAKVRELTKKELAAKELEERRLSLARRPSVPAIPHPGELTAGRPNISPRALTDSSTFLSSQYGDVLRERSHTVDPENLRHDRRNCGAISTTSVPIGLPATPRAMRHPRYMNASLNERDAPPAVPPVPESFREQEPDGLAPLLPNSVYGQKVGAPLRSASAPPENSAPSTGLPQRPRRGSLRAAPKDVVPKVAEVVARIDETADESNIIVVEDADEQQPPVLPELQHLAIPPPPPPPPAPPLQHNGSSPANSTSSGVINIAMDGAGTSRTTTPAAAGEQQPALTVNTTIQPATSASPNMHRRGRGSMGSTHTPMSEVSSATKDSGSGFSSRWKTVRERMRSESRSRAKSPPTLDGFAPSPYETVLPQTQFESMTAASATSPIEKRNSPPRIGIGMTMGSAMRNPKDIAREQYQQQQQQGRYVEGGMI